MTKYLIAFLILLSVATFAIAEDKHPCETNKCYAAFGFGFNDSFGFGSGEGGGSGAETYYVLLPSSNDKVLLPSSTDKVKLPGH